jgi:hypothetical protein
MVLDIPCILNESNNMISMKAPTCSILYVEGHSKGMGKDIKICGAVIANNVRSGLGLTILEVLWVKCSRIFEPVMMEPYSLKFRGTATDSRCNKLFYGHEP